MGNSAARLQSLDGDKGMLPRMLSRCAALTGPPVLANTRFRVRGEPIVCSREDAMICCMHTDGLSSYWTVPRCQGTSSPPVASALTRYRADHDGKRWQTRTWPRQYGNAATAALPVASRVCMFASQAMGMGQPQPVPRRGAISPARTWAAARPATLPRVARLAALR